MRGPFFGRRVGCERCGDEGGCFLEAGSTVRVVAYRRAAGGAAPDLSKDTYVDSKTYKVQSDGTSMVACDVDADGKEVTGGLRRGWS